MIVVNGREIEWEKGMTISDVLRKCDYSFPLLVTRVNGEFVERSAYATHEVPDNADLQIIHLMSGG